MKIKATIALLALVVLILSGCARVVSESFEVVPAFVTSANLATRSVTLVCKGRNEVLYGASFYNRFCEHVGDEVWAINRIRVYDNDKVKETVINLLETKEQAERLIDTEDITDEGMDL